MVKTLAAAIVLVLGVTPASFCAQARDVAELVRQLSASDPAARARASCGLRDLGDAAFDALQPLIGLLADAAPVDASICHTGSWHGNANDLTTVRARVEAEAAETRRGA